MMPSTRLLPLAAVLLQYSAFAGEPASAPKESAAVLAAQARLDAAAKELAEVVAREHPGGPAPMKIELRVRQEGEPSVGPPGTGSEVRTERRVVVMAPDEMRPADAHPMMQVFKHEMHGPLPDGPPRRAAFPDLELASMSPALGKYFSASSGVLVVRAGRASGLQDGDVITQIGQRPVDSAERARVILDTYLPGEPAPITVLREKRLLEVRVPVELPKAPSDR